MKWLGWRTWISTIILTKSFTISSSTRILLQSTVYVWWTIEGEVLTCWGVVFCDRILVGTEERRELLVDSTGCLYFFYHVVYTIGVVQMLLGTATLFLREIKFEVFCFVFLKAGLYCYNISWIIWLWLILFHSFGICSMMTIFLWF